MGARSGLLDTATASYFEHLLSDYLNWVAQAFSGGPGSLWGGARGYVGRYKSMHNNIREQWHTSQFVRVTVKLNTT